MTPEPSVAPRRETSPPRRRWVRGVLAVVLLVLVLAGWLAFRGYQAATALRAAQTELTALEDSLAGTGTLPDDVAARVSRAQSSTARAHSATADPLWRAAGHVPVIGRDLAALTTVSAAVDRFTQDALPTVVDLRGDLADTLRPDHGRVDVAALAAATPALEAAASAAHDASAAADTIDTSRLHFSLGGPLATVQRTLGTASSTLSGVAQAASLLAPMLGADGPRNYLVLALNNAELRTQGGIVGALTLVHAEDGAISIADQASDQDIPRLDDPYLPLTDEETTVYSSRLGRWVQNVTMTPDFPRAAALAQEMWRRTTGLTVDGVVAIDPVVVSYLLAATGPVAGPGGTTLDASTVADEVLRQAYLRYADPRDGDVFYSQVATSVFAAVSSGQGSTEGLVDALGKAAGEHRLQVWSAVPAEQRSLAATSVGGAFLSGGADDSIGVFLDDATGGKLDFYLSPRSRVTTVTCRAQDMVATVQVDLAYDARAGVAALPDYVVGNPGEGVARGSLITNVSVYAPVGGGLGQVTQDGGVVGGRVATIGGRQVEIITARQSPGETTTLTVDVVVPRASGSLATWSTPSVARGGSATSGPWCR